jgi:hypothetical protein
MTWYVAEGAFPNGRESTLNTPTAVSAADGITAVLWA